MKDNLHSYMKVGIVQLMAYPETDTVEAIEKIADDAFFGAIEIASIPEEVKEEVRLTGNHGSPYRISNVTHSSNVVAIVQQHLFLAIQLPDFVHPGRVRQTLSKLGARLALSNTIRATFFEKGSQPTTFG